MVELRTEITVEGVPGTWTTNLNDDDVRAFHAQCGWQAPAEDNIKVGVFNRSVGFKFQDRTVPFKDGACQWVLLNERNWVIYRTTFEWEIWVARRQEIDELKEEQEQERATLSQLMRTENDHLRQLAREAVLVKDFVKAERHLTARAELAGEIERLKLSNWWSYGIIENARHWFSCFPAADNGIEFLRRYDRRAASFIAFANPLWVWKLHARFGIAC
jgi:hypothetical protein